MKIKKERRIQRVRAKIFGTAKKPRLVIFKSLKYIYVQAIDDEKGHTLAAAGAVKNKPKELGIDVAKKLVKIGIKEAVFDRHGYQFHGKVKTVVEAIRAGGIKI